MKDLTDGEVERIISASVLMNETSELLKKFGDDDGLSRILFIAACDMLALVEDHRSPDESQAISLRASRITIGEYWESRVSEVDKYFDRMEKRHGDAITNSRG